MISFLIGSGFSVADGLPLVSEINSKLSSIKADEFALNADMSAFFLKEQARQNDRHNVSQKLFVEYFIKFYCDQIVGGRDNFNYETFFDYYSEYRRNGLYRDGTHSISQCCDAFRKQYVVSQEVFSDNSNLLSQFHNTFSQLLGDLLQKPGYYEDVSYLNYPPYDQFIQFLKYLKDQYGKVKVHTLNHDLLFERVGKSGGLWEFFSDGYSELNSPYYAEIQINQSVQKNYRVRLKYFQNKYDKEICLYKLHGSIDTYQFNIAVPDTDDTRVKTDYGIRDGFLKEIRDRETGEYRYIRGFQNSYPDFLSGTTTKLLSYNDSHYKTLFNHFKINLESSNILIVIGYGFGDSGINEYLEKFFLKPNKKMVVITPSRPKSSLMNYNAHVLIKKLEHVSYQEFINMIK